MPLPDLELSFAGLTEAPFLSVDGLQPKGPNLSHWPGNRTPAVYKSDLTTGICMRFVQASEEEQANFLGDVKTVLNDHYDTDGFLSLLTLLEPELVLDHSKLCLLTAATGDFQIYTTDRAFIIDAIVRNLAAPYSPIAPLFAELRGPERDLARYRWLCEHSREVLAIPERLSVLYEEELAHFHSEFRAARRGDVARMHDHAAQLATLVSATPIHRCVANTVAGQYRVLTQITGQDGNLFCYHDRAESWFEVCTITAPARIDLRPLALHLSSLERDGARWHADPPTHPVPELFCGESRESRPGQPRRELLPSSLSVSEVQEVLHQAFVAGSAN